MALGLLQWAPARFRPVWAGAASAVFVFVSATAPFRVIAPAYARPQQAPVEEIPHRLGVTFGREIELMGYRADVGSVVPGDNLTLTLYWKSLCPIDRDYSVFVHLLGSNDIVVAQRDTYPGRGMWPTSGWAPGQTFADTLNLNVPRYAYAPDEGQIEVGLYDFATGERLAVTGQDGRALGDNVRFHSIEVRPRPGSVLPNPVDFNFEGKAALVGYALDRRATVPGEGLRLTLYWRARTRMAEDYTVFAHVLGKQGRVWAQKDGQPQGGAAPTSGWSPDFVVEDAYDLIVSDDTPPGVYDIEVGLYRPDSGKRLGVLAEDGRRLVGDRVLLTRVRVVGR
jgi:hypothetical protein